MSTRITIWRILLFILLFITILNAQNSNNSSLVGKADTVFCTHKLVLDEQNKILPWFTPHSKAYDHFLHLRWDFIKNCELWLNAYENLLHEKKSKLFCLKSK